MPNNQKYAIPFRDLGTIDYKEAWDLQEETLATVINEKMAVPDGLPPRAQVIYFCEHPHVYTLGKSGQIQNLLVQENFLKKIGAEFYKIDRGGDITYHGPGQIVGYPVLDLASIGIKVKDYVWKLEESVIRTLADYGVEAGRLDGATGVWLDMDKPGKTRKISSVGVRISRDVTMHGFAFNVKTDLRYFQYINPCGFTDKGVTSLQQELGRELNCVEVSKVLKERLSEVFHIELITT